MKRILLFSILVLVIALAITPMLTDAKTKTISGTITTVEGGDGSVGTTVTINLGSNKNLKKGDLGWVSKGSEAIAYIKIISVDSNSSVAIVTVHENVNKVTSGLSIHFKVKVKEETIPEKKPVTEIKEPSLLWRFRRFNIIGVNYSVIPIIHNGAIYFGCTKLYSLNSISGEQYWTVKLELFQNSPGIYRGSLYLCSDFSISAFDAKTGYCIWAKETEQIYDGPPVFFEDMLFYSVISEGITARDVRSGRFLWRYKTRESIYDTPIIFDGKVYAWDSENIYCLNAKSGSLLWKKNIKPRANGAVTFKNVIIISCVKALVYLDKDSGEVVKRQECPSDFDWHEFSDSHPIVNGSYVIYNCEDRLVSINLDSGKIKWEAKLEGSTIHSAPVLSKGKVYIGDNKGFVYALDANSGKILWKYKEAQIDRVYGLCVEKDILFFICAEGLSHTSVDGWLYKIKIK